MPPRPGELSPDHVRALDQELMETLPGGIVYVRSDGSIAAANREAQRILGFSIDKLTKRFTMDWDPETIHEDGTPCPASEYPVSLALTTGQPQPARTIGVRRPDGHTSWAVFRATPVRDESGALSGALVSFLDITERKETEDTLTRHREFLRKAQQMAKIATWEWDFATNKVVWSEEMHRLYGNPPEFDGTVQSTIRRVHPEDLATLRARMSRVVQDGSHTGLKFRIVRPDGSTIHVWGQGEVLHDSRGNPAKMIGTAQDVTDQSLLEEQVRIAQRMETIGRLAGGVAHDFNNLLQVITANVEAGEHYGDPLEALRNVGLAAERASELTRQLLAFGKRTPFQAIPFAPIDLLNELTRLLPRLLGDRIRIELDVVPELTLLHGDPGQLLQVLINLAINARDAMPNGGTLRIDLRRVDADTAFRSGRPWAAATRYAEIRVRDEGTGIAPEVLSQIFEPFFTTKPAGSGSGLGLAVAYGIVQQHGGSIEVDSKLGAGTTFRVYVPVKERSGTTASGTAFPAVLPETQPAPVPTVKRTILLVDDEPMVRAAIALPLRKSGFDVLVADGAQTALHVYDAKPDRIDAVVTDVHMPMVDGFELADKLRERNAKLPIIFVTGAADARSFDDSTPSLMLRKPFPPDALLHALHELLVVRNAK